MPSTHVYDRLRFLDSLGKNVGALGVVLLIISLVAWIFWLGGKVRDMTTLQNEQAARLAAMTSQMHEMAKVTGVKAATPLEGAGVAASAPKTSSAAGSILSPANGQQLAQKFECTVRVQSPDPTSHYYLLLRQGESCYPCAEIRMPPGGATTAWKIERLPELTSGPCLLELREVETNQQLVINRWQDLPHPKEPLPRMGQVLDAISLQ